MLSKIKQWFSGMFGSKRTTQLVNMPEDHLISFSKIDTEENYLGAFWRWVEILESNDYQLALESLYWPEGTTWTAENLEDRIKTFYGGEKPWSVVIPNDRLVGVLNENADIMLRGDREHGWFLAQIPLTNEPEDPKDDEILLMGLAISFFVRPFNDQYVLEFDIFHL